MTYETNFAAYIVAAAMLLVVVVTQLAASGKIRRNGFVGLRIPPTMASEAAWVAGHRAARAPSWIGFVTVAIAAGVAQFTPEAMTAPIVLLFLFLGWSVVAAWRGAGTVTS
jgi:uncharacterized membrane protein